MSELAIVGAGAWGTALALQALRSRHHVALITRDVGSASAIKLSGENHRLPGFPLPKALDIRNDIPGDADLLLWAVPTQHLRSSFMTFRPSCKAIIICAKGVEANTLLLPSEVVELLSPACQVAILTGPNFAHEVAAGLPAAAVIASEHRSLRHRVLTELGTNTFRLYGNDDPIGAQIGAAAKNVIAIAAGAVIGAGLGENARAALVTRGLSELRRLAVALGGRAETVMGLSGLGDLLLTCTGPASRNFRLGHALGCGKSLTEILANRTVLTEGVLTAAALVARAGDLDLPICRAMADLLAGMLTVEQTITQLLSRPQRDE